MEKVDITTIEQFVRKDVPDWDDPAATSARFKALSGQRSDWESLFFFWRDLVIKVSRHFQVSIVPSSQVKNVWFRKDGLTPLCIDRVLHEMHVNGDILLKSDLVDPTSGRLYQIFKRVGKLVGAFSQNDNFEHILIITSVLQERISNLIMKLREEGHLSNECVITKNKFESFFKGNEEAYVGLSFICQSGEGRYFSYTERDFFEGVKLSLVSSSSVTSITKLDYCRLNLVSTEEKLNNQLDFIDQNWRRSRQMALTCLKSGNKQAALRHTKRSQLFSQSRDKFTPMLARVEQVIQLISDAESTKKVSEAIQIGTKAIKDESISIEEVYNQIEELDKLVSAHKEVSALDSVHVQSLDITEEEIEEELRDLEEEMLRDELSKIQETEIQETEGLQTPVMKEKLAEDTLSRNFSALNFEAA